MFSHVFPGIRDFERTRHCGCAPIAWILAAIATMTPIKPTHAEQVAIGGQLTFAPEATALAASQRQTLDELQRRRPPLCVLVGVRRSGGAVSELKMLEAARVAYVSQLFSVRGVTVLASGIGWRQPDEAAITAWTDTVVWSEARCPGTPEPARDRTQPQT